MLFLFCFFCFFLFFSVFFCFFCLFKFLFDLASPVPVGRVFMQCGGRCFLGQSRTPVPTNKGGNFAHSGGVTNIECPSGGALCGAVGVVFSDRRGRYFAREVQSLLRKHLPVPTNKGGNFAHSGGATNLEYPSCGTLCVAVGVAFYESSVCEK